MNATQQALALGQRPDLPVRPQWKPLELVSIQDENHYRFENDRYSVSKKRLKPGVFQLLIIREDQSAVRDWRDYQQIKNELCGPEWEGIELYPAESRKLDPSNAFIMTVFHKLPVKLGVYMGADVREPAESIAPQREGAHKS